MKIKKGRMSIKERKVNRIEKKEAVIVMRKEEKNVVIISLDKYNQLEKAARNAEYLAMIDRSIEQLAVGKGQLHELIEVEDE